MIKGDTKILYIKDTTWKPIGCLQSNSLSEDYGVIDTGMYSTTGWVTYKSNKSSYSISFSGIVDVSSSFGYFDVVALKRSRTLIEWKLESLSEITYQSGFGYISEISESAPAGEYLTFSGQIVGSGEISKW